MMAPSVAVIGSFRKHYGQIARAVVKFESADIIVTVPKVARIINPGAEFIRFDTDPPDVTDQLLQAMALEKIMAAGIVYVVAPNGYVGSATRYELGHARKYGIPVYFSEMPVSLAISVSQDAIRDVDDLIASMLDQEESPGVRISAACGQDSSRHQEYS